MAATSSKLKMEKVTYVCCTCGSEDVLVDGWAVWNKKSQQWELSGTLDASSCNTCGEWCKLDAKPIH
jgi:hypothetical protein